MPRKAATHSITDAQREAGQERLRQLRSNPSQFLSVSPDRLEAVTARLASVPPRYLPIYLDAVNGQGRTAALKAHCLECCGWDRSEVSACTALACALWVQRPYQKGADED